MQGAAFVPGLLCQDVQPTPDLPARAFTLCPQLPHRLQDLPRCCLPHTCSHPGGSAQFLLPPPVLCTEGCWRTPEQEWLHFASVQATPLCQKATKGMESSGGDRRGKCKRRLKIRRGERRRDQDFFLLFCCDCGE